MIGFASIVGGAPSSVSGMTKHLMNATLSQDENRLAAYYSRGGALADITFEVAHAVVDGQLTMQQGVDVLMEDWDANNPPPGREELEALRERGGWGPRRSVDDAFRKLEENHARRRGEKEAAVDYRLDVLVDRIDQGLLDAPLAVVRPDAHPLALAGLGISADGILSHDEINALISGHRADGAKIEGKKYAVERQLRANPKIGERKWSQPIGSYDFCTTPDKSVSVAWAFAGPEERAQIFNAHTEASREAIGYVAKELGHARLGKGGKDGFEPGHVAWLEFSHHTSRRVQIVTPTTGREVEVQDAGLSGDMNIHTHHLIPNAVFCESGRVGSLDTAGVKGFLHEAGGYYQARLKTKLTEMGFDVQLDESSGMAAARMFVIPEKIRTLFSKRTNMGESIARKEVEAQGKDWGELSPDERQTRIKEATQKWQAKDSGKHNAKGGKDDVADFADWQRQAKEAGWDVPKSFLFIGPPERPLTQEQRHEKAYEVGAPWLAEKLEHSAVIPHWDLRLSALRGLIHTGMESLSDIGGVTKLMREQGVTQYGDKTELIWGQETGKRYTSVTTGLHEADENQFVRFMKAAAYDKSGAIPVGLLKQKLDDSGMDFSTDHGRAQRRAIERIGTGGKFGLIVAAAGAGKTESLKPMVAAWKEQWRPVYGASLAWRQADDLVGAGIEPRNVKAFSVLLKGIQAGGIKLNDQAVVVVDEFGLLGTRQGLELLKHRERLGFTIVALGDDKQTASIEAGSIIALSRRALGAEQVPEIQTTLRQHSDREKEIAGLFRDGEAAKALDMKRADGTADMVYGGRDGVLKRVAEIYSERLVATGQVPTISAPTNSDAHEISAAVRLERRKLGQVGPDLITMQATDGSRDYRIRLAKGDNIRLFRSTGAAYGDGRGGPIGRNGSVLEVVHADATGVVLKAKNGRVGLVTWGTLLPREGPKVGSGRIEMAYGDATTIHTAQGSTRNEHIFALPSGSKSVTGGQAYTANTRHRSVSYLVTSEASERIAVKESRPINDAHEITLDDKWANVAKALSHQAKQDSALAMIDRVQEIRRGAVRSFQQAMRPSGLPKGAGVAQAQQWRKLDVGMMIARAAELARGTYRSAYDGPSR